jgi:hypothetical protein
MIEDREIWACANQIMQQYGEDAWFHAAQRADGLLSAGDDEGHRTWRRILAWIEALKDLEARGVVQ